MGFHTARILYYEVDGDLYVRTMREGARAALTGAEISVDPDFDWTRQSEQFYEICQYPGMLFHAGRGDDFEQFLGEFATQCPNFRPQHPIVAGDAVSRLIEDPARREATHSTLPLMYVSDALDHEDPADPGAVWRSLGQINVDGVTGLIDFTGGGVQRYKAVALLAHRRIGTVAAQHARMTRRRTGVTDIHGRPKILG